MPIPFLIAGAIAAISSISTTTIAAGAATAIAAGVAAKKISDSQTNTSQAPDFTADNIRKERAAKEKSRDEMKNKDLQNKICSSINNFERSWGFSVSNLSDHSYPEFINKSTILFDQYKKNPPQKIEASKMNISLLKNELSSLSETEKLLHKLMESDNE